MKNADPEWYKKLVMDGKELKAQFEANKLRIKIEIGKRLLQDKEKLDEKHFRKIARELKDKLIELDIKVRDMPFQLKSWMILAENMES